ncbi:MAG: 50S ribosomal protein L18 [candidate division Zixibacteria bacterium SM23_81]|nr:MAG: 50S ribosomal protein L18 [candidate division Zixibacteria bacterium SM23_81]
MQERAKKLKRARHRRKLSVRKKIYGTADRPRLSVYRSLNQIYTQLIDDDKQRTLTAVSSLSPEVRKSLKGKKSKVEIGKMVGLLLAKKAAEQGIKKVVFDRGPYLYHGRVKAVAQGVREGGLEF